MLHESFILLQPPECRSHSSAFGNLDPIHMLRSNRFILIVRGDYVMRKTKSSVIYKTRILLLIFGISTKIPEEYQGLTLKYSSHLLKVLYIISEKNFQLIHNNCHKDRVKEIMKEFERKYESKLLLHI